jgi:hypothetical protein
MMCVSIFQYRGSILLIPRSSQIFLAMEARDSNASSVAKQLLFTFKNRFRHIQYTIHPEDLAGEAPGKSSNISWAAKEVHRKYYSTSMWKDVMLTVLDSKPHAFSELPVSRLTVE